MYALVICAIVVLVVWGLIAPFTQGVSSTKKAPGDQLSQRGVELVQLLFWLVIIVGVIAVVANGN